MIEIREYAMYREEEILPYAYQIMLMTDNTEKTRAFYRSLGFSTVEDMGCRAFMKTN